MDLMRPQQDDHEAAMARADLFKCAQYSFKLFKMVHDGQQLEGWVQAKITKAADYIASVYHYMEYEMKFSEYGEQIENSDMYSESQKVAIRNMLSEAKQTMKKLTAAQAAKLKKDEKVKESWDDMLKSVKEPKGTGKFDKKEIKPGVTQYTRKSSTFSDGGDDKDVKAAKKAKKVKEQSAPLTPAQGQALMKSKDPNAYNKMKGIKTPAKTTTAVSDPEGVPAKKVKEATKAKKDYDGDGKIETNKDEVWGSRAKAAAKSGKPFGKSVKEAAKPDFLDMDKDGNKKEPMKKAVADKKVKEASAKCNHTAKGEKCPVHGLKECGMYEGSTGDYSAKKAAAGKDIGKPGKNFAKIEKSAGGGEKGKKIAGAVLAKLRKG